MSKPLPLVTQVLWGLERGGAERMVFDLASLLPARGYRVQVIAAGGDGPMREDFERAGIPLLLGPKTTQRRKTFAFLWKTLRQDRLMILHTHLGGSTWAGFVSRLCRIHPWIITSHAIDRDLPWVSGRLLRSAFRHADHVACVSKTVRAHAEDAFGTKSDRLSVIRSGINLDALHSRPLRLFHDVPRLVVVSRLVPGKGHELLLHALSRVKRPWQLDVLGDGSLRLKLERLAESLGLSPRVHFLGTVQDVPRRLQDADALLFPSESEGQGLALLEAAGSRVPAIVSDLSVFRETFDETSLVFANPTSVEDWVKKIHGFLGDPLHALDRATHAKEIVECYFRREQMADAYVALYKKLSKKYHDK